MILTGQMFCNALIIDQFCQTFTLQSAHFWSCLGFSFTHMWIWYRISPNEIFIAEYTKARIYSSSSLKHFLSTVYPSRLLILSNFDLRKNPTRREFYREKYRNSEKIKIEIFDKNYPRKKLHVSTTLLKFSWSNLSGP